MRDKLVMLEAAVCDQAELTYLHLRSANKPAPQTGPIAGNVQNRQGWTCVDVVKESYYPIAKRPERTAAQDS